MILVYNKRDDIQKFLWGELMQDQREALCAGAVLHLGDSDYEILERIGAGSNGIVYRARYPDRLHADCSHQVLIKELFPYTKERRIHRKENGQALVIEPDARELFDAHKDSFGLGNRAHLTHLWEAPELTGGNINSFDHNNTLYTVFTFDGGCSLEEFLEKNPPLSLRDAVSLLINLMDAVMSFHKLQMLHLDISPDNILLLPLPPEKTEEQRRVLLIDYNCVWMRGGGETGFYPGVKEGYSAPELLLNHCGQVGEPTDLFSVCAVFYRLLTGHPLGERELEDGRLRRMRLKQADLLRQQPSTVIWKVTALLSRGLRLDPANRFRTAAELRRDLVGLRNCIDGKGVTHSVLWEISRRQCAQFARGMQPANYLCETSFQYSGSPVSAQVFWDRVTARGENVLLLGSGGAGKTRALFDFWNRQTRDYSAQKPVVWYIPLCRYTEPEAAGSFVQNCLLEQVRPDDSMRDMGEAARQLSRMMEKKGQFLLLLDGLNEVSCSRRELLKEIRKLSQRPGVQVVLTERVDTVSGVGFHDFCPCELIPLTDDQVRRVLFDKSLLYPADGAMRRLLSNQLLLKLYLDVCAATCEQIQAARADITSPQELFREYQNSLWLRAREMFAGDEAELVKTKFVLLRSLPLIAAEMKRNKRRALTRTQLYAVMQKNYREIRSEQFLLAFSEFLGKSAVILQGISTAEEWFAYAVTTVLVERFKLLVCAQQDYYLFHEEFWDYLCREGESQRKTLRLRKRKSRVVRTAAGVCAAVLLLACGTGVYIHESYPFFTKDKVQVGESVNHLAMVLGNTYAILQTEESICGRVSQQIYSGSEQQYGLFSLAADSGLEKARSYAQTYSTVAAAEYIPQAEGLSLNLPDETAAALFTSPQEHFQWMEEHLTKLTRLLDPANGYSGQDRENALTAYRGYLTAYQSWLNWTIAAFMEAYPQAYRMRLYQALNQSPLFVSMQEQGKTGLRDGAEAAEKALANAEKAVVLAGI